LPHQQFLPGEQRIDQKVVNAAKCHETSVVNKPKGFDDFIRLPRHVSGKSTQFISGTDDGVGESVQRGPLTSPERGVGRLERESVCRPPQLQRSTGKAAEFTQSTRETRSPSC
jgi:hypothetical protein